MREMASNVLVADVFRMIAWMNVSLNANTFVRIFLRRGDPEVLEDQFYAMDRVCAD